jgi:hypothetical protein
LIQNVAVSPNSGSNYVVCVINKELSEHSWWIGRTTLINSHLISLCTWISVFCNLSYLLTCIIGCDHILGTCRPHWIQYYQFEMI